MTTLAEYTLLPKGTALVYVMEEEPKPCLLDHCDESYVWATFEDWGTVNCLDYTLQLAE